MITDSDPPTLTEHALTENPRGVELIEHPAEEQTNLQSPESHISGKLQSSVMTLIVLCLTNKLEALVDTGGDVTLIREDT